MSWDQHFSSWCPGCWQSACIYAPIPQGVNIQRLLMGGYPPPLPSPSLLLSLNLSFSLRYPLYRSLSCLICLSPSVSPFLYLSLLLSICLSLSLPLFLALSPPLHCRESLPSSQQPLQSLPPGGGLYKLHVHIVFQKNWHPGEQREIASLATMQSKKKLWTKISDIRWQLTTQSSVRFLVLG